MLLPMSRNVLLASALALLAACASSTSDTAAPLSSADASVAAPTASGATYELTDEEKGLDCKKLTGRMQVRILQVRDYGGRPATSAASRNMKAVTTTVFGGSQKGADPEREYQESVAMLQAYNRQLEAKKCKTFNLAEELRPKPVNSTPTPVAKTGDAKAPAGPAQ